MAFTPSPQPSTGMSPDVAAALRPVGFTQDGYFGNITPKNPGGTIANTPKNAFHLLTGYSPVAYANELRREFYATSVLTRALNVKYEGIFKKGISELIFRQAPNVSFRKYNKNEALTPEQLETGSISMRVDKGGYWCVVDDYIDNVNTEEKMRLRLDELKASATANARQAIEQEVLSVLSAEAAAENQGANAGRFSHAFNLGTADNPIILTNRTITDPSSDNAVNVGDLFANIFTVLSEQNIPEEIERQIIVPPVVQNLLARSEIKYADVTGDSQGVIRKGPRFVGAVQGSTVLETTNVLPIVSDVSGKPKFMYPIVFCTRDAATFALQLDTVETLTAERTFARIMRGLMTYGYKVTDERQLGVAWVAIEGSAIN